MNIDALDVLLFSFRDPGRAGAVLDAARNIKGLRHVAVVSRTQDGEIRVADARSEVRHQVLGFVLDALAEPLRKTTEPDEGGLPGPPLTLPATPSGLAAFARLVRPGQTVLLVAACDESVPTMAAIAEHLDAALHRIAVVAPAPPSLRSGRVR
jgi:hypothetical protein